MYAPVFSGQLPARVLFLSPGESSVRMDVAMLRSLGVASIAHMARHEEARAFLTGYIEKAGRTVLGPQGDTPAVPREKRIDAICCAEELADTQTLSFLRDMAAEPRLAQLPFLVITATADAAEMFRGLGINALARPYTTQELTLALGKLMSPMRRPLRPGAFPPVREQKAVTGESAASRPQRGGKPQPKQASAADRFRAGMDLLRQGRESEAEYAFREVLHRSPGHADACLALARIQRGRNDAQGTMRYLVRAAASLHRQGEKERAEAVTRMLPSRMQNGNIRLHEASVNMEQGEYRVAALGLISAGREESEPLHNLVARACMFTETPEEHLIRLCDALDDLGHPSTAANIRRRLLHAGMKEPPSGPHWLDNYPMLRDVVHAAGYAAWAWRRAG